MTLAGWLDTLTPYILGVLGGLLIGIPVGRIQGEERERERLSATRARLLTDEAKREAKYRELLADVDALKAQYITGRRAGSA